MSRKIYKYSLEIFSASVIVITLINLLFFPDRSLIHTLTNGFALIAILHEFEEKRTPGGFYELVEAVLGIKKDQTDLDKSGSIVMLYWVIILSLSSIFEGVVVLFIMLIALGLFEMVAHTILIWVAHTKKPYTPGMFSAWLMGAMSVYSIICLNTANMATGKSYLIGSILMIVGFAFMQRCTVSTSNLNYRDFLKNLTALILPKKKP